jgi:hypothetical protein
MPPLTPPRSAADLAAYVESGQLLTVRADYAGPLAFTPGHAYPVYTRERAVSFRAGSDPATPGTVALSIGVVRVLDLTDNAGTGHTFSPHPDAAARSLADLWAIFAPPPIATLAETHAAEHRHHLARLARMAAA